MIDVQSSASGHGYASDHSAIGAGVSHSVETQATSNHLQLRSEWLLFLDWEIPLYKVETAIRVAEAKGRGGGGYSKYIVEMPPRVVHETYHQAETQIVVTMRS